MVLFKLVYFFCLENHQFSLESFKWLSLRLKNVIIYRKSVFYAIFYFVLIRLMIVEFIVWFLVENSSPVWTLNSALARQSLSFYFIENRNFVFLILFCDFASLFITHTHALKLKLSLNIINMRVKRKFDFCSFYLFFFSYTFVSQWLYLLNRILLECERRPNYIHIDRNAQWEWSC